MRHGKIVLIPGSDGAPWELEIQGGDTNLAGASFTLLPADDGSYRVFVMRLEATHGEKDGGGGIRAEGFASNHNQTLLG